MTESHTHTNEQGKLVRCYHYCRNSMTRTSFWLGLTVGFLPEHFLWDKVPPFSYITQLVGLG